MFFLLPKQKPAPKMVFALMDVFCKTFISEEEERLFKGPFPKISMIFLSCHNSSSKECLHDEEEKKHLYWLLYMWKIYIMKLL